MQVRVELRCEDINDRARMTALGDIVQDALERATGSLARVIDTGTRLVFWTDGQSAPFEDVTELAKDLSAVHETFGNDITIL